jgi:hypothetical protein
MSFSLCPPKLYIFTYYVIPHSRLRQIAEARTNCSILMDWQYIHTLSDQGDQVGDLLLRAVVRKLQE